MWYIIRLTQETVVLILSIWITGTTRSGKTTRLVGEFQKWVENQRRRYRRVANSGEQLAPAILVLAANDDNRRELADKLAAAVEGSYPVISKTPLGFISDEVMLFLPLLFERLQVKAQFPLRLRPETEQELATRLWREELDELELPLTGASEYRLIRRTLDLLQLAGASDTPAEDIPAIAAQGFSGQEWETGLVSNPVVMGEDAGLWEKMAGLLLKWRKWCLQRGLLSYGLIYELYSQHLLGEPRYQQHLRRRYQAIFADDVDDYPAIARELFEFLLDQGSFGVFTFNPNGKVRLGLNADPDYLEGLADRCEMEMLPLLDNSLATRLSDLVLSLVTEQVWLGSLPNSMQSIQEISRASLLKTTAEAIIQAVGSGEVKPEEIAVIAPGLDAIARYTLIELLSEHGISVEPLNEQRALSSSPLVRSLLTLLALVYPGLGRFVDRDGVAEMLVVLSNRQIDPVRAGLLADYCYATDIQQPTLLSVESFPRWDRLGHQATTAYREIVKWIEKRRSLPDQSAISLLDLAMKKFLLDTNLAYAQLAALRELIETAQHYWQVDHRLRQNETTQRNRIDTVAQFITLLRQGTIAANPHPFRPFGANNRNAVTLATIFQYRSSRRAHRWHFWLDAASPLWNRGGAATLFGAELFLKDWSGRPVTPEDIIEADRQRLERILQDLLGRVTERVYLCQSDLAVNGSEQTGPLLSLVHASLPVVTEKAIAR
ncbi:MAG: recombinase family protein [Oscillatoria sp. PMC 1068.18]|nr:recombinase family protein [Oscillatoria sp. PMC 1068.18]